MPKKGEKSKHFQTITDVTIHEFANSNKVTDRQKKGKTIVGRHLKIAIDTEVGDNHAEASLVDGADDDDDVNDIRKLKSKRKSKRRVANENDDPHHRYAVYPIDVWLLISKHIQPENVCRFALICRQTAAICSSSSFWSHLYKTYYIPVADLPTRLQPECMVRFGGLRSCVIQSLHYMYQPFVDRLREATAQDFHCVEKRECVGSWTYRIKDHWLFCYKLKQKVLANSRLSDAERIRRSKRLLDIHSDIYQNTEEGCKILVIRTTSYRPLLQCFGQNAFLKLVTQTLSTGFTNYKLRLTFVNHCQEPVGVVVYDPVVQIQVLDWWTPAYRQYLEQTF